MPKSPFPEDFLSVDLFYSGDWQPLGTDLDQTGVRISHGARSEGSRSDASSLEFRVTNAEGKYSPRHPTSPLYGLVGRNTPVRAVVALGSPWLDLSEPGARIEGAVDANASTGLDLRWWGRRDDWSLRGDLMSKYGPPGQHAWLFRVEHFTNGNLPTLYWSANGVNVFFAQAFVGVPAWAGEVVLRALLTYDNGEGTGVVTFYYGTALDGPWVQMGPPIELGQVASLHASTEPVVLGRSVNGTGVDVPQHVYGFQVRDGDGGTILAGADFATDTLPEWTFINAEIHNRHTIARCEVAEWPVDWGRTGAPSVLTDVTANGVTRRLGQGEEALDSVLFRAISSIDDLVGYWPMEDGRDATQLGQEVGSLAAQFRGNVRPAAFDAFPGSAPLPDMNGSEVEAQVDSAPNTGEVQVRWVQHTSDAALPVSEANLARVWFRGGGIQRIDLRMRDSDGALGLFATDQEGAGLPENTYFGTSSIRDSDRRLSLELEQDGSDVVARWVHLAPGENEGTVGTRTFAGRTVGRVSRVELNPQARLLDGYSMGHLTVENHITSIFDVFGGPLEGWAGETAEARIRRLGEENGVAVVARSDQSEPLGEQEEESLLALMGEAVEADGGMLHDDQASLALRFRSITSLYSQPAVVIPYDDNRVIPFHPIDDDRLTRNRVTVTRKNGGRSSRERLTGPMSSQPPPEGVGLYDTSLTLNLATDDQADRAAGWLLHVGTWDAARYPTLGVDLANPYFLANPDLVRELLALTVGDRLMVTDPPPWLPPFAADVIVTGVRIEVQPLHVLLRWTCVPAGPYQAAYWNAGHRFSGEGTVLASAVDETATSLPLTPPFGVSWTHADGDYDITIGGEVMTVTDVVGDTMTVTRSVNSVVKAHDAGAAVDLAQPSFYAR